MTGMSVWFYGMFGLGPLLIIFGTILWNYMISLAADRLQCRAAAARSLRLLMTAGICGNLLVLAVFKYLPVVSDKAGFALYLRYSSICRR